MAKSKLPQNTKTNCHVTFMTNKQKETKNVYTGETNKSTQLFVITLYFVSFVNVTLLNIVAGVSSLSTPFT